MIKFGTLQGVLGEPLPQVFEAARDLGFDGVELDWRDPSEARKGGPLGPERRGELRTAAENAGVEICSVAAHFLNGGGLASSDEETQRFGLQAVREGIALCRDLGASALLVPFFGAAEIETDEEIDRLIEHLNVLAPEAEAANVTLAIEHSLRGNRAARILEEVGSTHINDYWDMGNAMCFGYDPIQEVKELGPFITRIHAKEYERGDNNDPSQRRKGDYPGLNPKPLGEGEVPLREIFSALQNAGYGNGFDGYIILETGAFGDRKASAKAALETLRSALPD